MICDICIIGSGQSGLTTCKKFIEKGYNVVVLEKNNSTEQPQKIEPAEQIKKVAQA